MVIATMRRPEHETGLSSIPGITVLPLDVTDRDQIEAAARQAFELAAHNIRIKTVSPGGIKTDFAGRSLDLVTHPAYAQQLQKVFAVFSDPARPSPPVPSRLRRSCMKPPRTTETSFDTWSARMARRCMLSVRPLDPRWPGRRSGQRFWGSNRTVSEAARCCRDGTRHAAGNGDPGRTRDGPRRGRGCGRPEKAGT